MLSWLFRRRRNPQGTSAVSTQLPTVQAGIDAKVFLAEEARSLWQGRLDAAQGDDAALLVVARESPVLAVKLAAVEALQAEDTLKAAEREFRSHDRSVHRIAKRRHGAAVAQREARARARALIETASAWCGETPLPANRLVALDADWNALDTNLLDSAQRDAFSHVRERLDTLLRRRADEELSLRRWTADATRVLAALRDGCTVAVAGGSGNELAARSEAAQALHEGRPDVPAAAALDQALQAALQAAASIQARLAWLAVLEHPRTAQREATSAVDQPAGQDGTEQPEFDSDPSDTPGLAPAEPCSDRDRGGEAERWREFPPLADRAWEHALNARFEQWQRSQTALSDRMIAKRAPRTVKSAPSAAKLQRVEGLLSEAESALADGQVIRLKQRLQALDAALEAMGVPGPDDAIRTRHQALHVECARLTGWQQWGGGRARDDLVAEAEELARIALAAAEPGAPRLHLKSHGDAARSLRARWKALDRLGAVASADLWQRFDAAMQIAYEPVAAQKAALQAARMENLAAREALLSALEAAPDDEAIPEGGAASDRLKDRLRALDRFHEAWRQLGPIEHTVPAAAQGALQQRLRELVERTEAPLQAARREAQAEREQFIVRAEALRQELAHDAQMRDLARRVHELQAEWQQHARRLPLARAEESALWTRFKATTDAIFEQRHAAIGAREAEFAQNVAIREGLLERLAGLSVDTSLAEFRRTLADVDQAWRQSNDLPRSAADALDARLRIVHQAALHAMAAREAADWQAQCDSLEGALAACEAREDQPAGERDADNAATPARGALPSTWAGALTQRWSNPGAPGPLSVDGFDDLLLRLETALDVAVEPQWQAARRELKLRTMKETLEGRGARSLDQGRQTDWLLAAIRQVGTMAVQRQRLRAIIEALRRSAPMPWLTPGPVASRSGPAGA